MEGAVSTKDNLSNEALELEAQLRFGALVWQRDPTDDEVSLESEEDVSFALKLFDSQYRPRNERSTKNKAVSLAMSAHGIAMSHLGASLLEKNSRRKARRGDRYRWLTKTCKIISRQLGVSLHRSSRVNSDCRYLAILCTQYAWPDQDNGKPWLGYTLPQGATDDFEEFEIDLS